MTQNTQAGKVIYPANVPGLKKAWTYTKKDAIESSPVVDGKMLYIGSRDSTLYALDARTGTVLWTYTTGGPIFSTPTVVDDVVYVGSLDARLYALEARTGALIWSYAVGNEQRLPELIMTMAFWWSGIPVFYSSSRCIT